MVTDIDKVIEALRDAVCMPIFVELCPDGGTWTPSPETYEALEGIIHQHIDPAVEAMRVAYDDNEAIRAATVEELHGVYSQVADFKERAYIMDSIHKETMEKLGIYKKAVEGVKFSTSLREVNMKASLALKDAAKLSTPNKGVEK